MPIIISQGTPPDPLVEISTGGPPGAGVQDATNAGTAGVGIVSSPSKVATTLQLKAIAPGSTKITATNNPTTKAIEIDIVEANIIHQNIAGHGTLTHAQLDAQTPTTTQKSALVGSSGTPGAGNTYVTANDPRVPTQDENDALAGTGTPSASNKYVTQDNAALTNGRAPSGAAGGQLGGTYPNPDVRGIREQGGPTTLTIATVSDGEFLKRSGSTIIGAQPDTVADILNAGTGGIGLPSSPSAVGSDLQLKSIGGSVRLSVTDNAGAKRVDLDVVEASIGHQNLSGAGTIDHAAIDARLPSVVQKAALAGSSGTPGDANRYVTNNDPRLAVAAQTAALVGTDGTPSADNPFVTDSDPRNTDSRAPTGAAAGQLSGTYPNPSVAGVTETSGPTALTVGAIGDGEFLKRVGATVVSQSLTTAAAVGLDTASTNTAGSGTDFAKANHTHAISQAGTLTPIAVGDTSSPGAALGFANKEHRHAVTAGTPVAIGTANATGSATTFVRSDHVHSHGNLTGGTLHAAVSGAANGFMIAADKTKIDGIEAGAQLTNFARVNAALAGASADIDVNEQKIVALAAGVLDTDAVNISQLNSLAAGLVTKIAARVASSAPINNLTSVPVEPFESQISLIEGDRVLVNSTASLEGVEALSGKRNGIYVVGPISGGNAPFTRATDMDSTTEIRPGILIYITSGTFTKQYMTLTTDGPIVLDTTPISFQAIAPVAASIVHTSGNETIAGTKTFASTIVGNISGNAATVTTVTTNANLTGPITSVGNATSVAAQTGTGSTFVMQASPTLATPNLGTPSALVGTNITGTASGLIAGSVTTIPNLTGDVTSVGNATTIPSSTITNAMLAGSIAYSKLSLAGAILNADLAGSIADSKLSTITTSGKVDGAAITGTIGGAVILNTSGAVTGGAFTGTTGVFSSSVTVGTSLTVKAANELRLNNVGDTFYTGFVAPALSASKIYTLPTADGTAGYVLTTNGLGALSWAAAAPAVSGTSGGIPYFNSSTTTASTGVLSQYQVVLGGGVAGAPNVVSGIGTSGQVLTSSGAGANPAWQTIVSNLTSGDVTSSAGVSTIGAGKVTNAMLAGSIAFTNLAALTSAHILVGNVSNVAVDVAVTGDVTISNAGVTAIGSTKVTNAMLAGSIAYSKLSLAGAILATDLAGSIGYAKLALTGSILNADLQGLIADTKLLTITTAGKVSGAAITSGTIGGTTAILTSGNIQTVGNFALVGGTFGLQQIQFYDRAGSNHYVGIGNPTAIGTNVTWTLPSADGSSGYVLSTNGAGTLSWAAAASDLTSGDVTSSSGVSTIGAGKVTNAMLAGSIAYSKLSLTGAVLNADLAGSIAYSKLSLTGAILNADLAGSIAASKLVGTDITTLGTITTGTWSATTIAINKGGTNSTATATAGGIAYGTGTAYAVTSAGTSGQLVRSAGASAPTFTAYTVPSTDGTNGQVLSTNGAGATTWTTGPIGTPMTVQKFLSGSGTYTTPANVTQIRVVMVGGGGGGGGSGTTDGTAATAGGNTTFGTSLLVANGGGAGGRATNPSAGGTASLGTGPVGVALSGSKGQGGGGIINQGTSGGPMGGMGAATPFAGAGAGGVITANGQDAIANTGSGGGGAGGGNSASLGYTGTGGSAGGFVDAVISSPSGTYAYAVGAAGTAQAAGSSGLTGGSGAAGQIIVYETYLGGGLSGAAVTSTITKYTSGSGTYTLPAGVLYLKVRMAGGGGGGGGSGATAGTGGNGSNSTFGTTLLAANGGTGGAPNASGSTGGTASLGTGPIGLAITGGGGGSAAASSAVSGNAISGPGGVGGSTVLGGAGFGGLAAAGGAGVTNTGGGGGGAGFSNASTAQTGAGGGAGGYVEAYISGATLTALGGSASYAVGTAGAAGTAGTSGFAGGAGGSGVIIIEEFYAVNTAGIIDANIASGAAIDPSKIGAIVHLFANNPTSTVTSSLSDITNWTEVTDTHSAFNPSTGIFTSPSAGVYNIGFGILCSGTYVNQVSQVQVVVNSTAMLATTEYKTGGIRACSTANGCLRLAANDTVKLQILDQSTSPAFVSGAAFNWLTIAKVGN